MRTRKYDVSFSVGAFDSDGDRFDDGIFLHMDRGDFIIRVADGDDLDSLIDALIKCRIEMAATMQVKFSAPARFVETT